MCMYMCVCVFTHEHIQTARGGPGSLWGPRPGQHDLYYNITTITYYIGIIYYCYI